MAVRQRESIFASTTSSKLSKSGRVELLAQGILDLVQRHQDLALPLLLGILHRRDHRLAILPANRHRQSWLHVRLPQSSSPLTDFEGMSDIISTQWNRQGPTSQHPARHILLYSDNRVRHLGRHGKDTSASHPTWFHDHYPSMLCRSIHVPKHRWCLHSYHSRWRFLNCMVRDLPTPTFPAVSNQTKSGIQ